MQRYTFTQTQSQHAEIFDKASVEPVLITQQERPSHVILAAETYQQLLSRLEELEDLSLGKAATKALAESSMVGSEEFISTLEILANG